MGWAALDNKHQVNNNTPKHAFEKAQKVYGKRMKNAPVLNPSDSKQINTDFDELLSIRKANSDKKEKSNQRFMILFGIALLTMIAIILWETFRTLP
jgi:regulator of sigma D